MASTGTAPRLKKILRVFALVLMTLFLIAVGLMLALRLPAFQTWVVQQAAGYLSSELQTTVTLEKIQIEIFRTLSIKGLYIEDEQGDTLLHAGEISSAIDLFAPFNGKIYLKDVTLKDAIFKLKKYPDIKGLNLDFIIRYFTPQKKDTLPSSPFDFNPGEITLENVIFVYRDERNNDPRDGMDFEDIRVEKINASIDNVRFENDTIYATVNNLTAREKSGFRLDYFETEASFSSTGMHFENLLVSTRETKLLTDLTFNYDHISDFGEFVEKVRMRSEFEESILSSNDLRYFAPALKGFDRSVRFRGKVRGTVSQLRGRDLYIRYGSQSSFKGDVSIAGLPRFDESFFDLVVDELVTNKSDVETIPLYPFGEGKTLDMPDNFSRLGKVRFNGKFTGFLNDFVAYGNLNTALGFISSDLNFKLEPEVQKSSYSGHLSAIGFDIGSLTSSTGILGRTSFKADVKGTGLTIDKLNARMDGLISSLELNQYNYKNITVNGQIAKRLFNGILNVEEENLGLDFEGTIDFTSKVPEYKFDTEIRHARLSKLKIIDRDTSSELNTTATINMRGTDIDNMKGYLHIGKTTYFENKKVISMDSLVFESSGSLGIQSAQIKSDILDMTMSGTYKRSTMYDEAMNILASFVPLLKKKSLESAASTVLNYDILLKNPNPVLDIFYPELSFSRGTSIQLELNNNPDNISLNVHSDSIRYRGSLLSGIHLKAISAGSQLSVDNNIYEITLNDTLHLFHTQISGSTDNRRSLINIKTTARDSINNRLNLATEINYLTTGKIMLRVLPSIIITSGKQWNLDETNTTLIATGVLDIANLTLTSGKEVIRVNGTISEKREDQLTVVLRDFETSILNPFLAIYGFNMSGIASGSASLSSVLHKPGIAANMNIMNAGIYGDTLGNAAIDFRFFDEKKMIVAEAVVDRGGTRNIEVKGRYYILDTTDSLHFEFDFHKTNITAFSGYARGLVSDIRGKATGKVTLSGPVDALLLTGKMRLQQTSFLVDYLNTRYNFSEEIEFTRNRIELKNVRVNDVNGNQAVVNGAILHDHFRDFRLQIGIDAKNFQMLNTTAIHNELFYGTAYGSGNITITGPFDLVRMDLAIKTEKNTNISIPLSNPEEVSESSFIHFVSYGKETSSESLRETDLSGIEMYFNLDVTPDAEVQLIFDSKIGDVIRGNGSGNIRMEITPTGDFRMFGSYLITSGSYLFTMQNLINKHFVVQEGGTIRWSGSPYSAEIDLYAVYKLRASLYDLVQDTTLTARIPIWVKIHLAESLMNPAINFNIAIPDVDPTSETLINRFIATDQERRKQSMSLLVLNRFSPAEGVENQGASSSGVGANAAELLSQQLSVWASQISNDFNIGVNYRAGDAFNSEEFEIALSTSLFNDRLLLDGNLGVTDKTQRTSNIIGDFVAEAKISKDGRFRVKAFNKTVDNTLLTKSNSPYTQGLGVSFNREFNTFGELWRNWFGKPIRKEGEEGQE